MKAYKVHYSTASHSASATLLVEDGETKEEVLSRKDGYFKQDDDYSRIDLCKEISLSEVMVRDLSAVEFMKLIKLANQ